MLRYRSTRYRIIYKYKDQPCPGDIEIRLVQQFEYGYPSGRRVKGIADSEKETLIADSRCPAVFKP